MTTPDLPSSGLEPVPVAPAAPEVPPAAPPAAPPAGRKRSKLPWILGGVAVAVLAIVGVVVAFVVVPMFTAVVRGPEQAVLAYDQAYAEVDCALFESVTTVGYREGFLATCEEFETEAQAFVESFSDYEVVVTGTEVTGGTAEVTTDESWVLDGEENAASYVYTLVLDGGAWKIDALQ